MPEITEKELPPNLKPLWLKALTAVQTSNLAYGITLLQAVLKESPGFLEGRKMLRNCELQIAGNTKKKGRPFRHVQRWHGRHETPEPGEKRPGRHPPADRKGTGKRPSQRPGERPALRHLRQARTLRDRRLRPRNRPQGQPGKRQTPPQARRVLHHPRATACSPPRFTTTSSSTTPPTAPPSRAPRTPPPAPPCRSKSGTKTPTCARS